MINLIKLNLSKKVTWLSLVFMFLSILIVYGVSIYYMKIDYNLINIKLNLKGFTKIYFFEIIEVLMFISFFYVILLALLELFGNTNYFDAYFIVKTSRLKFFISKIIAYIILILVFLGFIFIGTALIYLYCVKNVYYLKLLGSFYLKVLIYLVIVFFVTLILVLLFRNYFVSLVMIATYWIQRFSFNKKVDEILCYLMPHLTLDYDKFDISFKVTNYYEYSFLILLILISLAIYERKDLKL